MKPVTYLTNRQSVIVVSLMGIVWLLEQFLPSYHCICCYDIHHTS